MLVSLGLGAALLAGCQHTMSVNPEDRIRIDRHTEAMHMVQIRLHGIQKELQNINNKANIVHSDLRAVDESLDQFRDEIRGIKSLLGVLSPKKK